jgi:DNA-binding transcriptional LysR family regulator
MAGLAAARRDAGRSLARAAAGGKAPAGLQAAAGVAKSTAKNTGMQDGAMRWDDLRAFLALTREDVGAAAAGERIAALEAALGVRLFDRSPAGHALTEAGLRLRARAEAMEAQVAAAAAEVGGGTAGLSGTVRIGAPDGVATYLLAEACDTLSRDNPELQVQMVALSRIFSKREADLTITVAPPAAGRLTVHKLADYRLGLYARDDLVAPLGAVRSMADLGGLRGIGYISDMILDQQLDYYSLLGRSEEPALTSNSLMMQLRWCLHGAGICILPDFVARQHPELVPLLTADVRLTRAFYLVRHQDDARSERINRIAEVVAGSVRAALEGVTS